MTFRRTDHISYLLNMHDCDKFGSEFIHFWIFLPRFQPNAIFTASKNEHIENIKVQFASHTWLENLPFLSLSSLFTTS